MGGFLLGKFLVEQATVEVRGTAVVAVPFALFVLPINEAILETYGCPAVSALSPGG